MIMAKEAFMNATRNRTIRAFAGGACIVLAACALVWFAFQFAPGEPRGKAAAGDYASSISSAGNSRYVAEGIVDIPLGQTFRTEGVTWGKWFSFTEEERKGLPSPEGTLFESDGIECSVLGLKAVSLDSFAEWYPHYAETTGYTEARKHECKVLLAEIAMTNTSDRAQTLPRFALWSEDFAGANNVLENGAGGDGGYLLEELYGEPSDRGLVQKHLPDGWNVLEPGVTRSWTVPFLVYRSTFADPAAYDDIDPARFCLAVADYDPPTVYRLWLG